MILYLDTSALVKLYAEEPGRREVEGSVQAARAVAVSEIGHVETRSALARKEREGSFSADEHDAAVDQLRRDFREVYLPPRPVMGEEIARAGELARRHALRAYDAVHLATALPPSSTTIASSAPSSRSVLRAWAATSGGRSQKILLSQAAFSQNIRRLRTCSRTATPCQGRPATVRT